MIAWMAEEGILLGAFDDGSLAAFLGGFVIDDFRNAGAGAFCPDWCRGFRGSFSRPAFEALYREAARAWVAEGVRLHAMAVYASEEEALSAAWEAGFGKIVRDAARPTADLLRAPGVAGARTAAGLLGTRVRRASPADAADLAAMNADLAGHIGASPVLMPGAKGEDGDAWREWLGGSDARGVAFIAEAGGEPFGYIRAEEPQEDVSDAVHGPDTLAIDGLWVDPARRGRGAARALLEAVAEESAGIGKALVSVDHETTNPEANAFWTAFFPSVTFSLERRV